MSVGENLEKAKVALTSPTFYFILAIGLHFLNIMSMENFYARLAGHIFMALFGMFLFHDSKAPQWALSSLLIPTIALKANLLLKNTGFSFIGNMDVIVTLIMLLPIYVFRLWSTDIERTDNENVFIKWGQIIYFFFIIFFMITPIWEGVRLYGLDDDARDIYFEGKDNVENLFFRSLTTMKEMGTSVKDGVTGKLRDGYDQIYKDAYYDGQVEDNKHEPLGVYLESVYSEQLNYYDDEQIIVLALVKGKTLDSNIDINMSCYAETSNNKTYGDVTPKQFTIENYDERDIDCNFEKNTLKSDVRSVVYKSRFNFETMAYNKVYFMNNDKLRTLQSQDIDPFDQYGINDRDPIAVFTNGPVKLGVSAIKPLISLRDDDNLMQYGLTIDNRWDGKIITIDEVEIQIPPEFELDLERCTIEFTKVENGVDGFNIYSYKDTNGVLRNIEGFKSITCRMILPQNKVSELMGPSPIKTEHFRARVKYNYEIEKSILITVKKSYGTTMKDCNTICKSEDDAFNKCGCPSSCVSEVVFEGNTCGGLKSATSSTSSSSSSSTASSTSSTSSTSTSSTSSTVSGQTSNVIQMDIGVTNQVFSNLMDSTINFKSDSFNSNNVQGSCAITFWKYQNEAYWNANSVTKSEYTTANHDCIGLNFNVQLGAGGFYDIDIKFNDLDGNPQSYKGKFKTK